MKLGSSFDTKIHKKMLQQAIDEYGDTYVFLIPKSRYNLREKIIIPGLLFTIMTIIYLVCVGFYAPLYYKYILLICGILTGVTGIVMLIYKSYVIHLLDFIIVSPEKIDIHSQRNMFEKTIKSIRLNKIDGVYINKKGLWNSILDEGVITIQENEDDDINTEERISFGPIAHPYKIKERIEEVIHKFHLTKTI